MPTLSGSFFPIWNWKRKSSGSVGCPQKKLVLQPPVWTGHADFCQPFEFIAFMRLLDGLKFDVMLEAKSKDLALLRLRRDLQRYAPDVAKRFGLDVREKIEDEPREIILPEVEIAA